MKICLSLALGAILVATARPATLASTTWLLQVNNETELLTISTQGGPGAPGAANCRSISGQVRNVAEIRGWYCPSTGRVHFVHSNLDSGRAVRVFTGNVSDDEHGQVLHMAGTVSIVNAVFGDLGEYNFSATRQ